MNDTSLYSYIGNKEYSLADIVCACNSNCPSNFLVYTPEFCGFTRPIKNGQLAKIEDSDDIPVVNIYELRSFCADYELRWVKDGYSDFDAGKVVILADNELADSKLATEKFTGKKIEISYSISEKYLLWGKPTHKQSLTKLSEHRIKPIWIPPIGDNDSRAFLTFKEYFTEDEYGNLIFLTERLTGLGFDNSKHE